MKHYKNKQELIRDIMTIESIKMEYDKNVNITYELYQRWYETSPDSFKHTIISDQHILQEYVDLLNNIRLYYSDRHHETYNLFLKWKKEGNDSPWNQQDIDAANTLVSISDEGISNEWDGEHTIFVDINSKKVKAKQKKVTFSPTIKYNLRSGAIGRY
jgi:hypothetical protein